jgi:hypothetical protein
LIRPVLVEDVEDPSRILRADRPIRPSHAEGKHDGDGRGELGRQVLATRAFANQTSIRWDSLGRHQLRGAGASLEILSPEGE